MIDYIDAPVPFIVGVPKDVWNTMIKEKSKSFATDVAFYDVDNGRLVCNERLPDLPEDAIKNVYNAMMNIVKNKVSARDVNNL